MSLSRLKKTLRKLLNHSLIAREEEHAVSSVHFAEHEMGGSTRAEIEATIRAEMEKYVPIFKPNVECTSKTNAEHNPEAVFDNFFNRFQSLVADGKTAELFKLETDFPVCITVCRQIGQYLDGCSQIDGPVAESMKRLCYNLLPYVNAAGTLERQISKGSLPVAGFLAHHNSRTRGFLADALNGLAQVDEITNQSVISESWSDRPYGFLKAMQAYISDKCKVLPASFVSALPERKWFVDQQHVNNMSRGLPAQLSTILPNREWFVDKIAYQMQTEICFRKLAQNDRWQLIFVGDTMSPLCLAAFDTPRSERPPIIYYSHGILYGYPNSAMFLKADFILAWGARDENYYADLGFPRDRIIRVGSPELEVFPSGQILLDRRATSRLKLGIESDTKVIVYATTWDPYFYQTRSADEIQQLIIESISKLVIEHSIEKLVLFVKYHPYPTSDEAFSMSRVQYPFELFQELSKIGISVRLAKDLDDCLSAADCFLCHESTGLAEAVSQGVSTLSLDYCLGNGRPTLDRKTYIETQAHLLVSVHDSATKIAQALYELLSLPKDLVITDCRKAWLNIFDCGHSEGLMRVIKLVKTLLNRAPLADGTTVKSSIASLKT